MGIAIVSTVLGTAQVANAQSIKVSVPREYEVGRPFNIRFSVASTDDIQVLEEPKLSGLDLLYGPSISSQNSISYVNGQVQSKSESAVIYTVMAQHEGKYTISGLRLRVGNKELNAQPVTISIVASSGGRNTMREDRAERAPSSSNAEYKYEALVPRRSVYVQEALPIVYKLYATEQPRIESPQPTVYEGFVSLDLLGNKDRQMVLERSGGKDWVSVEMMKELLFAQHAGQLTIPANELTVLTTLRDPGGDIFLTRTIPRTLATKPITIEVKALPEEGKPADFSGAVGNFTARYELSSTEWRTNEATNLKLVLEGAGNLKIASLPRITLPDDIEVYDPVEHTEQTYEGGQLRSKRTIEYSLIPRNTGRVTIPSVTLSFFDPQAGQYRSTSTKEIAVQIKQGKNVAGETTIVNAGRNADDNTPYGLKQELEQAQATRTYGLWLLLGHLAVMLASWAAYTLLSRRRAERADTVGYAERRANKIATKRLTLAHKYLQENNKDKFLEEVLNALWGYLGDKLRLAPSELSRDNVSEHLYARGIAPEVVQGLCTTIDAIEFARFAPTAQSTPLVELYEQAREAISTIETSKSK